ncbi:MAG: 30S ribosomal protein S17 [Anaerolinea sp.]|jgi:small subunit ribosomal protein S17|nr:30S ribosomal protein S17 [Anaerolinea sp.]
MNERRRMTGTVTSNKMMKTVVVKVDRTYRHPLYRKVVHASSKVKAHDLLGCNIGDVVTIVEVAPISREKAWAVEAIVKREGKSLDIVTEEAVE